MPTLRFLGAVGTVTGSRFHVRGSSCSVLVDCGLFQGLRDLRRRNWEVLDLEVGTLDAVVVSHAHLDHSGYLPVLAARGLAAPVIATDGTAALVPIVLRDSAKLLDEDTSYAQRHGYSKHEHPRPLYTAEDVERALALLRPTPFGATVDLAERCTVELRPAGHILGSSSVLLEVDGERVLFSGDLGRAHHPLLVPPAPPPAVGTIVVESTYGDRTHPEGAEDVLADVINRTIARGGSVLIPAFAVDRTEVLLLVLRRLVAEGRIPSVPVWVDSPMALRALDEYRAAIAAGAADVRPEAAADPDLFSLDTLREARDATESMRLNRPATPSIVISASGMATGGRVVHHLEHFLPDRRSSVVLVGYQAIGTRGRDLIEGARSVKMHGRYVPVKAEVVEVVGLSVHADADGIIEWLASAPEPPRTVHVVHGEPAAARTLADRIADELGWTAAVPGYGEVVRLD